MHGPDVERKPRTMGRSRLEPCSSNRQLIGCALIEIREKQPASDNDRGVSPLNNGNFYAAKDHFSCADSQQRFRSLEPQQREILIDMLFGSGAPLLLVPANWNKPGPVRKAIVAWDGGASAARAVRDAMPLLAAAEMVEVVSVLGEKDIAAEASGADIARHLARHCPEVCVNVLPVGEDGVAATLFAHGILTRADLMVIGGYGHSRLREFILGGVTRDTLARTDIPTVLSH
jgi:nucleotide-binding universal stress UspA family protein